LLGFDEERKYMKSMSWDLQFARFLGWITRPWRRRLCKGVRHSQPTDNNGETPLINETSSRKTRPITLITGATGGIGRALALELGGAGDNLLLLGRNEGRLRELADGMRLKIEGEVLSLAIDLMDRRCVTLIDEVLEAKGFHVARLINNAGVGERDDFLDSDFATLEQVMDVNMVVLTQLTHHFLPDMVSRGEGAVINMASIGGLVPGPYQAIYYASKAYVINLTEALAHEVRGKGVYIAAILPGPTKTKMHDKINSHNALYLKLLGLMRPEFIARETHRALLRCLWPIVTPGIVFTILAFFLRVIPASLMTPLMGVLYKKK